MHDIALILKYEPWILKHKVNISRSDGISHSSGLLVSPMKLLLSRNLLWSISSSPRVSLTCPVPPFIDQLTHIYVFH